MAIMNVAIIIIYTYNNYTYIYKNKNKSLKYSIEKKFIVYLLNTCVLLDT